MIDVFRAFSAAAYAFAAGATRILLAAEVDEARNIAGSTPDAILMGEVNGAKPDGSISATHRARLSRTNT